MRPNPSDVMKFLKPLIKTPIEDLPDECILWPETFTTSTLSGHAIFRHKYEMLQAHDYISLKRNKLRSRHKCENLHCVNPKHLEPRPDIPNENGHIILTEAQVIEIYDRYKAGETRISLSDEFGVSRFHVYNITVGKAWAYLKLSERDI